MFSSLCILGRQPSLGLAELESLFSAETIQRVGDSAALLDISPGDVPFSRLGGAVKLCRVLTTLDTTDWQKICVLLEETVSHQITDLPKGKIKLGLSLYGFDIPINQISPAGLSLKNIIKKAGRSARVVPNTASALNSAQVLHNRLTGPLGMELVIVRDNNRAIVAQTSVEQDIASYTLRDRGRPKRDARVGMLPPKLAQIILNLALGQIEGEGRRAKGKKNSALCSPPSALTVLDPFCGTGVLLQEALLMGYDANGTDIDPRMIEYTKANLDWLQKSYNLQPITYNLMQGDATSFRWTEPFDVVATETYLGRPFTTPPDDKTLSATVNDCNVIIKKFLGNLANQTKSDTRLCLAVPAWHVNDNFIHLPLLDSLTDMGYTRLSFVHADNKDLIYYREGQIVARELIVLIRL